MNNKVYNLIFGLAAIIVVNFAFIKVTYASVSDDDLIKFANISRQENDLGQLAKNPVLTTAALNKANDILQHQYFAHTSPEGKTPWDFIKGVNYNYVYAGENLAIGYDNPQELHNAWMNSPTHRENILNPNYREIGIAVKKGVYQDTETIVVVQMFGSTNPEQPVNDAGNQDEAINVATESEKFELISDKTGFSPSQVNSGTEVNFTVGYNGKVSELYFELNNTKIDFKEELYNQKSRGNIFTKKVIINQEENLPVKLVVVSQSDSNSFDLGKLLVNKKTIAQASDVQKDTNKLNNSLVVIVLSGLSLLILSYLYLSRRYLKLGHI